MKKFFENYKKRKEMKKNFNASQYVMFELSKQMSASNGLKMFAILLGFSYLAFFAYLYQSMGILNFGKNIQTKPYVAVVEMEGVIANNTQFSSDKIIPILKSIEKDENVLGIVLKINSGGGSPVQSEEIYQKIIKIKEKGIKVISYIEEIGASGAYYVAAASDEIYTNPNSLVGSIGVTSGGFGFTGLMDKLGVERRLYNSGENKSFLDPFSNENPKVIKHWESVLKGTHSIFIDRVKEGRGDKLKENDDIFSGLIWSATQAKDLGLIDDYGIMNDIIKEKFNTKNTVVFKPSVNKGLFNMFGMSFAEGFSGGIELKIKEYLSKTNVSGGINAY